MGLTITTRREEDPMAAGIKADRRLWLTADEKTVVEDGDPRARFLLAAPGRVIPEKEVARLGLTLGKGGKVQLKGSAPAENKQRKPGENKGVQAQSGSTGDGSEVANGDDGQSFKELQARAKELGIKSVGVKKDDLIAAIAEAEESASSGE